jgi:hypothetical protein
MDEASLTRALETAFEELDGLVVGHRQALAYEAARERTDYLLARLRELRAALGALRADCLAIDGRGGTYGEQLWSRTCSELRDAMPAGLDSLGRALVAGDSALLDVVAYLGAALALVRERIENAAP